MNCEKLPRAVLLTSFVFFSVHVFSQGSVTNRIVTVHKTTSKVTIDGSMAELGWRTAAVADSFINKWPTDSGAPKLQTEVRILYDDNFLYFGIKADRTNKNLVIQSLKRDVNPYYSDGVSVVLDPSGKSTSGYTFGVNAAGAQMEGIVEINTDSFDWDSKWFSASRIDSTEWTAEIAIPFKSFRFPKDQKIWGINFIRNDMTNNCFSTWNQVPIQFFGANLNCLGKIELADGTPEIRHNNAFVPYLSAKLDQDAEKKITSKLNAGFDAKIALGSSLNVDATFNPDFSQVDVDRQIINLDRFNVLLPEKRTFFLENSDLFAKLGIADQVTPFVSRKIGLTQEGAVVPIIGGLRLTGNVDPSFRIGIMNIQTLQKDEQSPQNYTVASIDHKILSKSNLRAIFTNRQETSGSNKSTRDAEYNRVAGAEMNLLSNNTKFNGRVGYYQSFNPGSLKSSGFGLAAVGFTNKHFNLSAGWHRVNTNFIADVGFTPRLYNYDAQHDTTLRIGYDYFNAGIDYFIYPASRKKINSIQLSVRGTQYTATTGQFIEFNGFEGTDILFANRCELQASFVQSAVNLPFPTTIFSETGTLDAGRYQFNYGSLKWSSNFLKPFAWSITAEHGGYFNGTRTTIGGSVKYRLQPWGNFGLDFVFNNITLNKVNIRPYIVSPTIEIAFSNSIFWTTFVQYNTQIKNFNFNSRFQWRFKPLSDIYLVYADNYFTDGFVAKGRSLVLKFNYWFN